MSSVVIYHPGDREFYGGLEIGWTKQLRLARRLDKGKALDIISEWSRRNLAAREMIVLPLWWRVKRRDGRYMNGLGFWTSDRSFAHNFTSSPHMGMGPRQYASDCAYSWNLNPGCQGDARLVRVVRRRPAKDLSAAQGAKEKGR